MVIGVVILLLVTMAALFWVNYQYSMGEGGGVNLAVYWNSARTVLFEGATPYGELASLRSQFSIFGVANTPDLPPLKLDLPFHVETLLLPLGLIRDFQMAQAVWMTILEISLVVSVFLCLRFLKWTPSPFIGGIIIIFTLFFVHGLWAIILGNAIILAGLLLSGVFLALREEQDELAGILLALATFKFLSVGFLLAFILLWAGFRGRKRVFLPFAMTFFILILVSFFFYPNWFISYARAIFANLKYGGWLSPAAILQQELPFIGEKLGWMISLLAAIILLVEWWLAKRKEFSRMVWTAALTLVITPLLGIPTYPENYVIQIISLFICLFFIADRWKSTQAYIITGVLVALFVSLWVISVNASDVNTALFFPLPISIIAMLYWIRWWVVSRQRDQIEPR